MKIESYLERFEIKFPSRFDERQKRLSFFEAVLTGEVYDNLRPFYNEYTSHGVSGEYIPLCRRQPSIKYKIAKIIVNEISSILFGETHFPQVRCGNSDHAETSKFLQEITRTTNLRLTMINSVKYGSVGSVAIVVKYFNGNFAFEVIKTKFLTPEFDQFNREVLVSLIEKKFFKGKDLEKLGYSITEDEKNTEFCLIRKWTEIEEIYYIPFISSQINDEDFEYIVDKKRSVKHDLGFVPVVWIKNPHSDEDDDVDGNCIFSDIIDIGIEIDYQLSQHGRLLKYNSDPTLVIKDPTRLENQALVKGVGALMIGEDGDAKYLQLESSATEAVLSYVKKLREYAIEVVRGDRSNPDKLLAGHSGKALQMLNKPMISLADEMRVSYGEVGLINIYKMIYRIATHKGINTDILNAKVEDNCDSHLILDWPQFYPSTDQDRMVIANTLRTLVDSANLSHKTAISILSQDYKITDVDQEIEAIAEDQKVLDAKAPQIKENINA